MGVSQNPHIPTLTGLLPITEIALISSSALFFLHMLKPLHPHLTRLGRRQEAKMKKNSFPSTDNTAIVHTFTISTFRNKQDATPRESQETWAQLTQRFSTVKIRAGKDGPLFSPARFSPARRSKENVTELSLLVLDYDHDASISDAVTNWRQFGVRFLLYTTHSHQRVTEGHKQPEDCFRIVIPLSEPIPASEFPRLWEWASVASSGKLDPACKDASRMYYLPAKVATEPFEFHDIEGELLDWRKIETDGLKLESQQAKKKVKTNGCTPEGKRELNKRIARLLSAGSHQRNDSLNREAFWLGHYVARGELSEAVVIEALQRAAYTIGLDEREIMPTINSGLYDGIAKAQAPAAEVASQPQTIPGDTTQVSAPDEWEAPAPFFNFELPDFPADALPSWLRSFVESLSSSTQTPLDLAALMSLAVSSAAVARNVRVEAREGWEEPLNIFVAIALPPANRKSQVVSDVTKPLYEFERELILSAAERIAEEKSEYNILVQELADLEKKCAKADVVDREHLREEAKAKARELAARKVPTSPKLIVDDVTSEVLATILSEQGGRVALFSAEGGIFETLAGRYANGMPNIDVFLKGHSGDDLRVDRRDRSEHIEHPALTIGLAVQNDVLRGMIEKPGFRGRGLIGRFLYSLPLSSLGHRKIRPGAMSGETRLTYNKNIFRLAAIEPVTNTSGETEPQLIRFSKDADDYLAAFEEEIEPMLSADGDLALIGDWGGKLAGATVRLAGILHLVLHVESLSRKWPVEISPDTLKNAIKIARYLLSHARVAYAEMGADQKIEDAKAVLRWIEKTASKDFSKRDAFNGLKHHFKQVAAIEPALKVLEDHGYIQSLEMVIEKRKGRIPSQIFIVNPLLTSNGHLAPTRDKACARK